MSWPESAEVYSEEIGLYDILAKGHTRPVPYLEAIEPYSIDMKTILFCSIVHPMPKAAQARNSLAKPQLRTAYSLLRL